MKNFEQQRNFFTDTHRNIISPKLYQGAPESSIFVNFINFRAFVLELHCPQNFGDLHTDKHFQKIVKSCSGHLKTCKSVENRRISKIFSNPILFSCVYRRKYKICLYVFVYIFTLDSDPA